MRVLPLCCLGVLGCLQPATEAPKSDVASIEGPLGSSLLVPMNASTAFTLSLAHDGFPAPPSGVDGAVFVLNPSDAKFASAVTLIVPAGHGDSLWSAQAGGPWKKVPGAVHLNGSWAAGLEHGAYFASVSSGTSGTGRVYFGNGGSLSVYDLATATESDLVPGAATAHYVTGVAVDPGDNTVYWTDNYTDAVARIAMSGGTAVTLHTESDPFSNPSGVAVDVAANKLFWSVGPNVVSAALDGSGASALWSGVNDSDFITSVAIDASAQRVYWTNNGTDTVSSATYAGADLKVLHTAADRFDNPRGVAVDATNGKLFWAEGNDVMTSALDGSGAVAVIAGTSSNFPTAVALDPAAHVFYWTDNGNDALSTAAYDGSHVHVLYTNPDPYSNPCGVAVAP